MSPCCRVLLRCCCFLPRPPEQRGRRRDAQPPLSPVAGLPDDDDLLAEILVRLLPKPSSLPRASLVCKLWRSIATDAAFRRRFRARHRKLPVLGAFLDSATELKFVPLLDLPDRIPSERFSLDLHADGYRSWSVLGCRHGRVLLINRAAHVLLVFEPVSGDTHRIILPPVFARDGFTATANGAVLCAAGDDQDHVHGDCHTSPFKVVVVGTIEQQRIAVACVYSSETGVWGDIASTAEQCQGYVSSFPCILIRTALYWFLTGYGYNDAILQFDLDNQSLTLISKPPAGPVGYQSRIIRGEDGGLGLAILSYPRLQLWDFKVDCHGVATWMPWKKINMDQMLGPKANSAIIVGYAEDADAIFMSIYKASYSRGLTIVQLEPMMVKECHGRFSANIYHPLTSFYTAGIAKTRSTPVIEPHQPSSP
uniref:Uncharacterized protein n=1 Tax=Avena sativa TaxID=4498 RepID=A0ACD5XD12_AVESA